MSIFVSGTPRGVMRANPVPDCRASLEEGTAPYPGKRLRAYAPYGAISVGQKGEQLADLDAMAPEVIAFSDDGKGVQSGEPDARGDGAVQKAWEKILAAHCEIIACFAAAISTTAHMQKRPAATRGICSESEWGQIARDVRLAEGQAVHIMCATSPRRKVFRSSRRQNGAA